MPARTKQQQRFMGACAHGAGYKSCPPQDVAEEFSHKPAGGYDSKSTARKIVSKLKGKAK